MHTIALAPSTPDLPRRSTPAVQVEELTLGPAPTEVAKARTWACAHLTDVPTEMADRIRLVLSEAATNALRHTASGSPEGETAVKLLRFPDRPSTIELRVTDAGSCCPRCADEVPQLLSPNTGLGGRGLALVDSGSEYWTWLGNPNEGITVLAGFRPR